MSRSQGCEFAIRPDIQSEKMFFGASNAPRAREAVIGHKKLPELAKGFQLADTFSPYNLVVALGPTSRPPMTTPPASLRHEDLAPLLEPFTWSTARALLSTCPPPPEIHLPPDAASAFRCPGQVHGGRLQDASSACSNALRAPPPKTLTSLPRSARHGDPASSDRPVRHSAGVPAPTPAGLRSHVAAGNWQAEAGRTGPLARARCLRSGLPSGATRSSGWRFYHGWPGPVAETMQVERRTADAAGTGPPSVSRGTGRLDAT